jgi:hypothetical protein
LKFISGFFSRVFDDLIQLNPTIDNGKKIFFIELKISFIYLIENRERTSSSTVNTSTQQETTDKTTKGK